MADLYDDLVELVSDWSNRDLSALPNSIIQAGLRYAADTAYRDLKVPALEATVFYVVTESGHGTITNLPGNVAQVSKEAENNNSIALSVPADLSTFIHLRKAGTYSFSNDGETMISTSNGALDLTPANDFDSLVWNEKTDVRTFHDMLACKVSSNFWTRQGNTILMSDYNINIGDVVELFYYRRLPALNARYTLTSSTMLNSNLIDSDHELSNEPETDDIPEGDTYLETSDWKELTGSVGLDLDNIDSVTQGTTTIINFTELPELVEDGSVITIESSQSDWDDDFTVLNVSVENNTATLSVNSSGFETFDIDDVTSASTTYSVYRIGALIPHWLRDENEKVVLFGALWHIFDDLGEEDMSQKYLQNFIQEIQSVNEEEDMRKGSGGNVQVHYSSILI